MKKIQLALSVEYFQLMVRLSFIKKMIDNYLYNFFEFFFSFITLKFEIGTLYQFLIEKVNWLNLEKTYLSYNTFYYEVPLFKLM